MATEVIITGSGSPNPTMGRAGAGALVRTGDLLLQFDAGRSTVERLAGAGVRPPALSALFVTHHHDDHLSGVPDLLMTRWVLDGRATAGPLPVVVPAGPLERFFTNVFVCWEDTIVDRLEHSGREVRPQLDVLPFDVPDHPVEVWSRGDVRVLAGRVRHDPIDPAVGYRVETPDGIVVISGDTRVCDEVAELADGADVLIHEALRVEAVEAAMPHLTFIIPCHADTRALGRQAMQLGVPKLVLTHLIPPPSTPDEVAAFESDIRTGGYAGEVVVANDLDVVVLGA